MPKIYPHDYAKSPKRKCLSAGLSCVEGYTKPYLVLLDIFPGKVYLSALDQGSVPGTKSEVMRPT